MTKRRVRYCYRKKIGVGECYRRVLEERVQAIHMQASCRR